MSEAQAHLFGKPVSQGTRDAVLWGGSGLLVVGAVVGITTAVYFSQRNNPLQRMLAWLQNPRPGATPHAADIEWAAVTPQHWTNHPNQPAGTRPIPFVGVQYTPYFPGHNAQQSWLRDRQQAAQALLAHKAMMAAAGRSDEDARCAMILHAIESGHGRNTINNNCGNIGATPSANENLIRSQQLVWTEVPEAGAVYVYARPGFSRQLWYAYPTLAAYATYEGRVMDRNYPLVRPAWRVGGLEGCRRGADGLSRGNDGRRWSPQGSGSRQADHAYLWGRYERLLREQWTR